MKNYLLVYRTDYSTMPKGTAEEAAAMTKRWMDWMAGIAEQNKLVERGNRLGDTGKVVKAENMIINGPYAEIKESIGGYSVVRAESYDDAVALAKGCPILSVGGNIEVREISEL